MVAPLVAMALRTVGSNLLRQEVLQGLVRQGVATTTKGAAQKVASDKLVAKAADKLARQNLAKLKTSAARDAAKKARGELSKEATERGLKGEARKQYYKDNAGRVRGARDLARDNVDFDWRMSNLDTSMPRAMRRAGEQLARGDLDAAAGEIRKTAVDALRRTRFDMETGRRSSAKLDLTQSRLNYEQTLDDVLKGIGNGMSPTESAYNVLAERSVLHLPNAKLFGKRAADFTKAVKAFNKELQKIKGAKNMPERMVRQLMRQYFIDDGAGGYTDDDGNPVTLEDLEAVADKFPEVTPDQIRTKDPITTFENRVRAMLGAVSYGKNRYLKSFNTTYLNTGFASKNPELYNLLMARLSVMSYSQLGAVIESGVWGDMVEYFASGAPAIISSSMPKLLRAVGITQQDLEDVGLTTDDAVEAMNLSVRDGGIPRN